MLKLILLLHEVVGGWEWSCLASSQPSKQNFSSKTEFVNAFKNFLERILKNRRRGKARGKGKSGWRGREGRRGGL